MAQTADYAESIRMGTRAEFAVEHGHPFLVGMNPVPAPVRQREPTGSTQVVDFEAALTSRIRIENLGPGRLQVLAVRKVGASVAAMITVGRSASNDVVIEDSAISKFHAFFVEGPDGIELIDAGSTNGTFVGDVRLHANRPGSRLHSGDRIRFASLEFEFLDAGACFDRVRGLLHFDDAGR